jgi:DNA-binding transcriptional LysR family regulator
LFDRGIRPLAPTWAGVVLYEHARTIMTEVGRTFDVVRAAAMLSQPQLNIGVINSFVGAVGPYLFANIGKIASHYRVWSGLGSELECDLLSRQIDILIAPENIDGMSNDLVSFELLTEPYVLAIPGDWKDSETDLDKLARDRKFIRYSLRSVAGKQVEQHLQRIKVSPSSSYEFDVSDSVLGLVGGGLGWAITTPLCCLQAKGRLQNVRILPLPNPGLRRRILLSVRDEQFRRVGESISLISQTGIRRNCIPEIKAFAAWAVPQIIVGKTNSLVG